MQRISNGPEIAWLLTNLLHVQTSRSTLKKEIEDHTDYPSLLSISNILIKYGIENLTARFDAEKLNDILPSFITQIKPGENQFELHVSDLRYILVTDYLY